MIIPKAILRLGVRGNNEKSVIFRMYISISNGVMFNTESSAADINRTNSVRIIHDDKGKDIPCKNIPGETIGSLEAFATSEGIR